MLLLHHEVIGGPISIFVFVILFELPYFSSCALIPLQDHQSQFPLVILLPHNNIISCTTCEKISLPCFLVLSIIPDGVVYVPIRDKFAVQKNGWGASLWSCSSSRWDFHFHSYELTIYVRLYWILEILVIYSLVRRGYIRKVSVQLVP